MQHKIKEIVTRFRAYQLGNAGSSFSYYADGKFTLIEGRVTAQSLPNLKAELAICGKTAPDTLHITSWDNDHCSIAELGILLKYHPPARIEYPGYKPESDCGKACLSMILEYKEIQEKRAREIRLRRMDPEYIASLESAHEIEYRDIVYHPRRLYEADNDNSVVKIFRKGVFNVLSLGDVMDPGISAMLRGSSTLCREADVMILAHHGADNGFTTKKLLQDIKPTLAVCTSNWGNRYGHPTQTICNLLTDQGIQLHTTKRGDILIESVRSHTVDYKVTDYMADGEEVFKEREYRSRKAEFLMMNQDSFRNRLQRSNKGPR
jgi:competence protein ComEC